jgi:hypothetical protein
MGGTAVNLAIASAQDERFGKIGFFTGIRGTSTRSRVPVAFANRTGSGYKPQKEGRVR